jgi:hypothetical protein
MTARSAAIRIFFGESVDLFAIREHHFLEQSLVNLMSVQEHQLSHPQEFDLLVYFSHLQQ